VGLYDEECTYCGHRACYGQYDLLHDLPLDYECFTDADLSQNISGIVIENGKGPNFVQSNAILLRLQTFSHIFVSGLVGNFFSSLHLPVRVLGRKKFLQPQPHCFHHLCCHDFPCIRKQVLGIELIGIGVGSMGAHVAHHRRACAVFSNTVCHRGRSGVFNEI